VQSDQQHFSVVKLPILQIALESLVLPFQRLPEFISYAWIPFVGTLVARFIDWVIGRTPVSPMLAAAWMPVTHFVLFTPFCVVWTPVALEGSDARLPARPFVYERTEWKYLLATVLMTFAFALLVGIPLTLYQYGQRTFDTVTAFVGGLLLAAGLVTALLAVVRLAFIFPAIATGRYQGLLAAWRQTTGNLESLGAVMVLAPAPYYLIDQALRFGVGHLSPGLAAMVRASAQMLMVTMLTSAAIAAPALAYKRIVLQNRGPSPGSVARH
jgi:hypothetical protein